MREWLYGDGWRYQALSAIGFVIVALPVAVANAALDWSTGVTYAVAGVSLVVLVPFIARKHLFWPPGAGRRLRMRGPRHPGQA